MDEAERRRIGAATDAPALGRGPANGGPPEIAAYRHPAAGWGAATSVARVIARTREPLIGPARC